MTGRWNMVNEEKVKLMNKMALYEEKYGKEDFKIASYYKKDYVSYQTIFTVIWVTIGYVVLFGVFAAAFVETFLSNVGPVSYTHLDVYKRQADDRTSFCGCP